MSTLVTVLHVIVCLFLMLTVLLQSGKGGGMGAAFGGGNAATVFGGSGASGFLKRLTAIAGSVFMITSMVLAFLSSRNAADALESFGSDQEKISHQKDRAREAALKAARKTKTPGVKAPSISPLGSNSSTPDHPGSASSGSSSPTMGSNSTPPAGSATPVEKPTTGSGTAEKPADPKPADPKPADPKPGSGSAAKKP